MPYTKLCPDCEKLHPVAAFPMKSKASSLRRPTCLACWRLRNSSQVRKSHRESGKAYLIRKQELVMEYLLANPCIDCGESDPVVLEFDHRDPTSKVEAVSVMVINASIEAVQAEIAKCDIRCANCHRRKTAVSQNNYKVRYKA